jgi:hypothetical protein
VSVPGVFFSAEISEIPPKTGFTGDHRYFLIPNEISGIPRMCINFTNFDKFWTNLELHLINLGRYLLVFRPVFLVFPKTGFLAAYRYFFPNEKKILGQYYGAAATLHQEIIDDSSPTSETK